MPVVEQVSPDQDQAAQDRQHRFDRREGQGRHQQGDSQSAQGAGNPSAMLPPTAHEGRQSQGDRRREENDVGRLVQGFPRREGQKDRRHGQGQAMHHAQGGYPDAGPVPQGHGTNGGGYGIGRDGRRLTHHMKMIMRSR